MTLKLMTLAGLALAILGAVWIFVVIPAEKRHHQRRIDSGVCAVEISVARKCHSEDSVSIF